MIALVAFTLAGALGVVAPLQLEGFRMIGWILVAFAALLVLWALSELVRARTTFWPWRPASALVTTGSYSFSRNPMYLGLVSGLFGLALIVESGWLTMLTLAAWWTIDRFTVQREERRLKQQLGTRYKEYLASVRRWL